MTELVERTYLGESPVALVIGCGDIGVGCARALGRRDPLLIVDMNGERLEAAVAALRRDGHQVSGFQCDITDAEQVNRLAAHLSAGPGVRVLTHVAALGGGPWRDMMRVNLIAVNQMALAVKPQMVRGGVAILISSTGSYSAPRTPDIEAALDDPLSDGFLDALVEACGREPTAAEAYNLAKYGVNRLAKRLAVAWGKDEVRALSLSPGMIDTTMGRTNGGAVPFREESGEQRLLTRGEMAARTIPLARQGSILEICAVVEFLASQTASFINGCDLPVDGGGRAFRDLNPTLFPVPTLGKSPTP